MTAPGTPAWDVDVRRRFEHAGRRFELHARFATSAQRLVLFGPSGAGKSQTLKMVAGLTPPDAGHVRLGSQVFLDRACGVDIPSRDRRLGFMFQDYALFPHLNVAQNVAFGLRKGWRNPRPQVDHPEVRQWLEAFELTPLASHHPEQLSGGQRQRTALARALVAQPRALLLDEPFAALDTALRSRLRAELAALLDRLAIPMILITHDEADVACLGGEVLHMRDGHVLEEPTAESMEVPRGLCSPATSPSHPPSSPWPGERG